MRIVMVSNNYTPYSGGVVNSINAIIPVLQAAGHEVTLITLQFLDDHSDDPPWVIRVPCCIRFKYRQNHMAIPWRSDYYVEQEIAKLAPDIVHSHHPFLLGNSARKVAKKMGILIVFTYHTVYEKYAHYVPLPAWLSMPIIKKLVRNYCVRVDGIIAPSRAIYEYMQGFGIQKPCVIIPSGILPIFIGPDPWVGKKKVADEPFTLLTVGRFVPEKNMPVLLDLFSQLDQSHFTFTLVGYGSEFERIRSYAYTILKLSPDRVRFIYKPEKTVLAREYRAADLFLFSSTTDTQGLVLAEAMAAGTPVLAVDGPGQRDIVRDGFNGFLVSSFDQMRNKIELLAGNQVLHAQLCAHAHETAREYYPKQMAAKLCEFYKFLGLNFMRLPFLCGWLFSYFL